METPGDVLGRTGAVLRRVAAGEPRGSTTTEVAQGTGLARATAHRLLEALGREGLVERDQVSHRWLLGPELFLLGRMAGSRYDVSEIALPVVRRLALETGESAFFSVRRGEETVCLLREDGSFPIRSHVLHEGIRLPLGVGSAGLAILAYLPEPEIRRYLDGRDLTKNWGAQHAAADVSRRLDRTRQQGWALNAGHIVEGSWGLGAAVFDARARPQWALSLTGIEQRFDSARQPDYGRLLLDAAHRLGRILDSRGRSSSTQ